MLLAVNNVVNKVTALHSVTSFLLGWVDVAVLLIHVLSLFPCIAELENGAFFL